MTLYGLPRPAVWTN